ncbi:MAG: NAD-dependent epimerase/dehydratase family protein [Candidatus Binatia bacterium]|nr:NAD-dependent epimerase/dehydratase family protein [Candidatus Binatia bacterium]
MRGLLTGATRFIGFHEAAALVRDSEKGERLLGPLGIGASDLVRGDMTDPGAVQTAVKDCDAAMHAAAGVSVTSQAVDLFSNLRGTKVGLGAAIARAVVRENSSRRSIRFQWPASIYLGPARRRV